MSTPELIQEIIATYQRHGWQLRRVSHPEWVQRNARSGTTSVVQINQLLVTGGLRAAL